MPPVCRWDAACLQVGCCLQTQYKHICDSSLVLEIPLLCICISCPVSEVFGTLKERCGLALSEGGVGGAVVLTIILSLELFLQNLRPFAEREYSIYMPFFMETP